MRCNHCNIDLDESAEVCPLCGAPAENIPPVIDGIVQADYPEHPEPSLEKKEHTVPNKFVLYVTGLLCLIFCISNNGLLFSILAPIVLFGVAVYLFICGLREKGELLHSAVALLAEIGAEAILLVLNLILRHNVNTTLFTTIITIALTVMLYAFRTERFSEQMKALLHR